MRTPIGLLAAIAALAAAVVLASGGTAAPNGLFYVDPAWSPNGKEIAVAIRDVGPGGDRGDLWIVNADGANARRLTKSTGASLRGARYPTWSPDGKRLAFGYGSNGIYVVNRDGTGLHRIATGCCPDWSRNGRRIAYAVISAPAPTWIAAIRPDGKGRVAVTRRTECPASMPTWSPNGERIAFTVGGGECPDQPYLGIVSSFRRRVSHHVRGHLPFEPDWSPGGRKIAYSSDYRSIVVLDLKTGRTTPLGEGQHPRFSPNGRRIVFGSNGVIYTMNAVDGSDLTRLVP
jgi:Tol biopolymer transport system component